VDVANDQKLKVGDLVRWDFPGCSGPGCKAIVLEIDKLANVAQVKWQRSHMATFSTRVRLSSLTIVSEA